MVIASLGTPYRVALLVTLLWVVVIVTENQLQLLPRRSLSLLLQSKFQPLPTNLYDATSLTLEHYYQHPMESKFCANNFGPAYLELFSNSSTGYCRTDSKSSLNCFHGHTLENERSASFCITGGTEFNLTGRTWTVDCRMRPWTKEDTLRGTPSWEDFPTNYWANTGPRKIFADFFDIGSNTAANRPNEPPNFTILARREDNRRNLWHSLMEIFSLSMMLDVLRISVDPATNKPFYTNEDFLNTQVVVLDDGVEGPWYDLWGMFSPKPLIRLSSLDAANIFKSSNVILPPPVPSNPLWEGDWVAHGCGPSSNLDLFSKRVLDFYKVDLEPLAEKDPLVLTWIDRKRRRTLIDKDAYLSKLQARFPEVKVNLVDFATLSLQEQLHTVRRTDILAGTHGAGLTHAIFMRPGSAMVEILPHNFFHKGFRNIAKLKGHSYFGAHAPEAELSLNVTNDLTWQQENIRIEEDRFMELLSVAIKSMYNRGTRNDDII